ILGERLPQDGPTRPAGRSPAAARDDQGCRARRDRGHQLRDPVVQAPRLSGGLRGVQASLQLLPWDRPERVQEGARVVRDIQGHHPLYRRQAPPGSAGAEARQGARRTERAEAVTASETHQAIDAVWRIESAKLIAALTRMVGDVGVAERSEEHTSELQSPYDL